MLDPNWSLKTLFSYITIHFFSRYNTVWISNKEIGLDPNNSVIKRLCRTAIFHGCKNDNYQKKNCDVFLIFAQNIDCGYTLEP